MQETVSRRLELLQLEGMGASVQEIVKALTERWHCSERTVYYDFARRAKWQPILLQLPNPERTAMKIEGRWEFLYRKASDRFRHADSEMAQLGYFRCMMDINKHMQETLLPSNRKFELTQTEPFIIKMWRPENAAITTKE